VFGRKVTLRETTSDRPALAVFGSNVILAWQGVHNNQLNTLVSMDGGTSFERKFTSGHTSIGGPALATGAIVWTGTNTAHNLNVATVVP
jgi:hypothetical protein